MRRLRATLHRLTGLFRRRALEAGMNAELQAHLDGLTERNIAKGMTPSDARYAAMREFGGVEQIKEQARDERRSVLLEHLGRDLRFALRMINSHRCFSLAIIVTLALGIGINTTAFALVNAVLFKPLPIPGGERLVTVMGENRDQPDERIGVSYPDFLEFRAQNRTFEGLEAVRLGDAAISGRDEFPERVQLGRVSAGLFPLLRTPPAIGRGFVKADELPGAELVILIAHHVWTARYGAQLDVVGRPVRLNGALARIVGVMPKGFAFPQNQDCWIPLVPATATDRAEHDVQLFGLLKPETSLEAARTDMSVIAARLAAAYPDTNKNFGAVVRTFQEAYNGEQVWVIFMMMLGAAVCVLLIACANVANLMLSRSVKRTRELSLRAALGATRGQLIRQLLVECLLLSGIGGVVGLGLAAVGVRSFDMAVQGFGKPYWIILSMDSAALVFAAAISIGSGVIFGLLPALRATKCDLNRALKDDTSGAGKRRGGRLTALLVVSQFALTLVLLAGAGMMIRSFIAVQNANSFVPADSILTAQVQLPEGKGERYSDPERRRQFYSQLLTRAAALPGVTEVALASQLPGLGASIREIEIEGQPTGSSELWSRVSVLPQSPGYHALIGLPILAGRAIEERDGGVGQQCAVVTRTFASKFWPGRPAVGQRFRFVDRHEPPGPWITVIGLCADMVPQIGTMASPPLAFVPYRQEPSGRLALLMRTRSDPTGLGTPARGVVKSIDPDLPLTGVQTLSSAIRHENWFLSVFGTLFFLFAATGLLMAAVGIYGVVAQVTAYRTREIGIRIALGASVASVIQLVLSRGFAQLLVGLVLGSGGAIGAMQLLAKSGLLYQATSSDPVVFVTTSTVLLAIGSLACWLPARRAAKVNPVVALRYE